MLTHVTINYHSETSPVENTDGIAALVRFAGWMQSQTQFPDVKPLHVHWAAEKPPRAFALFETPDVPTLEAYLGGLPAAISVEIQRVRPLNEVVQHGIDRLAARKVAAS